MGLIDFILNLACVLLWINWRSIHLISATKSTPLSLSSTLKKTDAGFSARWVSLATLLLLLSLRTVFYWDIGGRIAWTPSLDLGVMSIPFRSDFFWRVALFSLLSFLLVLAGFYAWLILFSIVNRNVPTDHPVQRLVRLHLGWIDRWSVPSKLLLPLVFTALLWGFGSPGLVRMGIMPAPLSSAHHWQQAVVLGLSSYLVWKVPVLIVCLLYLVNSYVYLGESLLWSFINVTGANLLRPLRRPPVCIGKIDLSPLLAFVVVLGAAQGAYAGLFRIFQHLPL